MFNRLRFFTDDENNAISIRLLNFLRNSSSTGTTGSNEINNNSTTNNNTEQWVPLPFWFNSTTVSNNSTTVNTDNTDQELPPLSFSYNNAVPRRDLINFLTFYSLFSHEMDGYEFTEEEKIHILDRLGQRLLYKEVHEDLKKEIINCSICYENYVDTTEIIVTNCFHVFCIECLKKWIFDENKTSCPMCRNTFQSE